MKQTALFLCLIISSTFSLVAQTTVGNIFKRVAPTSVLIKTDRGGASGFLVSSSGTVVTAYHVIDKISSITVKTNSGDVYDYVDLIAKDERKDIAVLRIPGFGLPYANLGNSNELSPGDQMIVVGNPLAAEALSTSVSDGVLSGIRDLGDGFKVLQITAPISPGNSGGAVYNSKGEAVGVVSFKLTAGEALNFAIPINYVRGLLADSDTAAPILRWTPSSGKTAGTTLDRSKNNNLDITGTWKASDGQVLRFKNQGKDYLVLNLTYTEVNSRAALLFDDIFYGIIYNGGAFGRNKYYIMQLRQPETLYFYFFDNKSKESNEQFLQRIQERLKKKPDTVLVKID